MSIQPEMVDFFSWQFTPQGWLPPAASLNITPLIILNELWPHAGIAQAPFSGELRVIQIIAFFKPH